jgi:uncharacterized protein (UPF0332 family)
MTNKERADLVTYRITTSTDFLMEIPFFIEKGFWNSATNRMYYACFHAVSALLLKHNHKVSSHKGARILFGHHFVRNGLISPILGNVYSDLFQNRHSGDYTDYFDNTEESVKNIYPLAQELIHSVKKLIEE